MGIIEKEFNGAKNNPEIKGRLQLLEFMTTLL
jgi:hypothetical protein